MQLNDFEIARRKELLEFGQSENKLLCDAKAPTAEDLNRIVDDFYTRQTEIDEIALIIGDAKTSRRLRAAQRAYISNLFAGYYDEEYVKNRLRIGLVHKRVGVEPK